jgi:hypothetical protein
MHINPRSTHSWDIVILRFGIFSLVGIPTTFGGLLAINGGALALSLNPNQTAATTYPPPQAGATYSPTCDGPLRCIQEYQRRYCDREQKYV